MADATGLRKINIALVRQALRHGGVMSKSSLAHETGLSFPTVSRTVDMLVKQGELREAGPAVSTGGRCAQRYACDPQFRVMLCVQLEGRHLFYKVYDLAGAVLGQGEAPQRDSVLQMLDGMAAQVRDAFPNLGGAAFGVDCPLRAGVADGDSPAPRGLSVVARLEDTLGVPVSVAHDIHLAASGYCVRENGWKGVAVCIYLGASGMRASLVAEGEPFMGASGVAGELHALPIKNNREYARTHFAGADMVAYYMQVIRAYAALVNPARVVLYSNPLLAESQVDRIRRACAQTLPGDAVPEIRLSHTFREDYQAGLLRRAEELTERQIQLLYD